MNTVTRCSDPHNPWWKYKVIEDNGRVMPFANAQAMWDWISEHFPGVWFDCDTRHAQACAARSGGQCAIPTHCDDCAPEFFECWNDGSRCRKLPARQASILERHEDAKHDAFMESVLERASRPVRDEYLDEEDDG